MTESKLTAFLKKNRRTDETFELKIDKFDAPLEFRIVSGAVNDQLQKQCMKTVRVGRKTRKEFDSLDYQKRLAVESMTFPPLTDDSLQKDYGVIGARDLYDAMFNFGEQTLILETIMDKSGLDQDINDEIDESKN